MPAGFPQDALAEARGQLATPELQMRESYEDVCYNWPTDTDTLPDLDSEADWNIK